MNLSAFYSSNELRDAKKLCLKYSDAPTIFEAVLDRLRIEFTLFGVIPSTWNRDFLSVLYRVAVNEYVFDFHSSHHHAVSLRNRDKKKSQEHKIGMLYSVLCSIRSDYCISDPEEIGMNPDSIRDMALWNEIQDHSRKLQRALRLSSDELNSLPC